jgi:hypothetical protein
MRLARFDREEFIWHRFDWQPGEHLAAFEPTQQGKSHLLNQLLRRVLAEREPGDLTVVSLMPKPRDPATSQWAPRLGLKVIDRWPPPARWPGQSRPPGYVLWPRHLKDAAPAENRAHLAAVMRPAVKDLYWRGDSLLFADDAHIAAVLLGLNPEFEEFLTAGGGMGSTLWLANQKPSGSAATGSLTTFAYSAATHLFFGHDPDERNLKRLSEIGGVNPELVAAVVRSLPVHRIMTPAGPKNISEKLYIHKLGYMCVVGL